MTSLIDEPEKLAKLVTKNLTPSKSDVRQFGEVFTPLWMVNEMLDQLPKKVWSNPDLKWIDPATGMGNFPIVIFQRLMEGLGKVIPSAKKRKKHILEKMLFMCELSRKNIRRVRQIFDNANEFELNLYQGDSLKVDFKEEDWPSTFDIIVGNPPYNKAMTSSGSSPLYHEFIEHYIDICKYLLFVVPSRWFSGGKGLNKFRASMLARKDIRLIKHYDNASEIFKGVSIQGGVNYFVKDSSWNGLCNFNGSLVDLGRHDVLIDGKYDKLLKQFVNEPKLSDLYQGRCYGIETNDSRLTNKSEPGSVRCFVSQKQGFHSFVNGVSPDGHWKVITARATGGTKRFANTFIGKPKEVHSGSYISFKVNSLNEAKSLLSYMKCQLPNLFLSFRMNSHNLSKDTVKWIPLPPLDRIWDENEVEAWRHTLG